MEPPLQIKSMLPMMKLFIGKQMLSRYHLVKKENYLSLNWLGFFVLNRTSKVKEYIERRLSLWLDGDIEAYHRSSSMVELFTRVGS